MMETSSILAEDKAVGTAPPPPPNEKGYDAGAAMESGNRERVVEAFRHRADNLISKADEVFLPPYPSLHPSFGFRDPLSQGA